MILLPALRGLRYAALRRSESGVILRIMKRWLLSLILLMLADGARAETPAGFEFELGAKVDESAGTDWEMPDGGTLHLRVIDLNFVAVFLDEERVLIEPPVDSCILQGEETHNRTRNLHLVLQRGDGPLLTHPRFIPAPHDFWLRIVIPKEEKEPTLLPRQRFTQ